MAPLPLALLDALIKGSVVIGVAAALTRLLRGHSAAMRHAVWATALLAQLALPALSVALPAWDLPILPHQFQNVGSAGTDRGAARLDAGDTGNGRQGLAAPPSGFAHRWTAGTLPVGTVALIVWLLGAAAVLARLALGTATAARLARRAQPADDEWLRLAEYEAAALDIRRQVTVLRGDRLSVPVTWGTMHPIVLLPRDADSWTAERRRLVLVHELAHVKRCDALVQRVGQIALALFWVNPLVWLAVYSMAKERERACDDYVLRCGTAASAYAQELLEMARALDSTGSPAFATLALAHGSDFEGRMLAILSPAVQRQGVAPARAMLIGTFAALLVLPLAALRPVARRTPATRPHVHASASRADRSAPAGTGTPHAAQSGPWPQLGRQRRAAAAESTAAVTPQRETAAMGDANALALCGPSVRVAIHSDSTTITVRTESAHRQVYQGLCDAAQSIQLGELAHIRGGGTSQRWMVIDLPDDVSIKQYAEIASIISAQWPQIVEFDSVMSAENRDQMKAIGRLIRSPEFATLVRMAILTGSVRLWYSNEPDSIHPGDARRLQGAPQSTPPVAGNRARTSAS